jgi:RNA polymerase sigma-70 factor (ECF subfamily)
LWRADLQRWAATLVEDARPAAEIAQEAWIAIARGLRRLDDPACFPPWAFQIVRCRAADWIRRRQGEEKRRAALAAEPRPDAGGRERVEANGVARLRELIAQLAPATRELLHLFYAADRSVAEIAAALGIPSGTVKSRLFTAREALKRQLERTSL